MKLNTIALGCLSFVAGATVGYLVSAKVSATKYARYAEEEIQSVKERYCVPIVHKPEIVKKSQKKVKEDAPARQTTSGSTLVRVPNEQEQAKLNYNLISKPNYEKDEDPLDPLEGVDAEDFELPKDVEEEFVAEQTDDQQAYLEPYVIDYIEYAEGDSTNEKHLMYYYVLDDTVCDEDEQIVPEYAEIIGWEALHHLDMATNVWVRNDRLGADYEIIRVNGSYSELVAGIVDLNSLSPRERQARLMGRKIENEE